MGVNKQANLSSLWNKSVQKAVKSDLPPWEIPLENLPDVVSTYYSTQLSSTYSHYEEEVNKKRKKRSAPARAYGTRIGTTPSTILEGNEQLPNKRLRSAGDDEGQRYLDYLWQLVSKHATLSDLDQQRLVGLIRCHALHGSKDMSVMAFRLMQYLADQHPITDSAEEQGRHIVRIAEVKLYDQQSNAVEPRSKPWTFVGSKLHRSAMHQADELPRPAALVFEEMWKHAADQAEQLAGIQLEGDDSSSNVYRNFGEFWLLKLILSEMQRDMRHRLSVYAKPRTDAQSGTHDTLLFNSQLWRMLENFDCDASQLVRLLMRCIGASAAPEDAQEEANQHSPTRLAKQRKSPAPSLQEDEAAQAAVSDMNNTVAESDADVLLEAELFGVAELAEMATMLLNMILELYGSAEQAGLFQAQRKVSSRGQQFQTRYTRIQLDHEMVDGLVGAKEVLKLVPLKAAFLAALHPRDCLRLLGMAVSSRFGDTSAYPLLSQYKAVYSGSMDNSTYLDADPVSILKGIMNMPQHQGKLLHKEGSLDALAMGAAATVQAALQLNLQVEIKKIFPEVLEFFQKQARGEVKHYVSKDSWAMLAGAACTIKLMS